MALQVSTISSLVHNLAYMSVFHSEGLKLFSADEVNSCHTLCSNLTMTYDTLPTFSLLSTHCYSITHVNHFQIEIWRFVFILNIKSDVFLTFVCFWHVSQEILTVNITISYMKVFWHHWHFQDTCKWNIGKIPCCCCCSYYYYYYWCCWLPCLKCVMNISLYHMS